MKKINFRNPFTIYLLWLIALLLYAIIGIPVLSIGYSDGEQRPLTLLFGLPYIAIYGFFALSIVTIFLNFQWFKKYWYLNALIFLFTSTLIVIDIIEQKEVVYDFGEEKLVIGDKEFIQETEYFLNTDKIRSRKFFLNNKRDSTWSVYDINGKLISREVYKNGKLLKKEKFDD